ncbi:MAG TPA: methylated-DNA--[protein]-cysteine S-methyltransferase [Vineibacter sp.]|nr:methylated-DNA--[protein]-cysteine S-methyltransferase [Vineibacter sp.]
MTSAIMHAATDVGGETIRFATGRCWLGVVLVAISHKGVCAILLGDDPQALADDLAHRFAHATVTAGDEDASRQLAQVIRFVEAPARGVDFPLDLRGTPFEQRVWQALMTIPVGSTASYGDIARSLGEPRMAREVGEACAANALAIAVPCHRIVKADGGISGYRWGVRRKRALLQREAA